MGNSSKKPVNPEAIKLMEGFLKAYEELHPSKIDKKAAGAKIVLQHVHSVLLSIADEAEHFALNFSHDLLGDVGAIIVAQQVAVICPESISALYLRNSGLTAQLDRTFFTSLADCTAIARLDLSFNNVGSELIVSLLDSLKTHRGLNHLSLAGTESDDSVCEALVKFRPPHLSSLDLSDNANITDSGGKALASLLDVSNQLLRCLVANCPKISPTTQTLIASKADRNLSVARVLDECLLQLKYYRFDLNADKRTRREVPHWITIMPRTLVKPTPSARFAYGHAETIGKRPTMEDAILLCGQYRDSPDEDLFGVFDGHGGDECAKFVQRAFPTVLAWKLAQYPSPDDVEKALKATYEAIDLEAKARFNYIGSTALVAYIRGDTLWMSNAGDARAVLATKGVAERLSYDHKGEDPAEAKRVVEEGGFIDSDDRVSGKLAVTRAFGDRDVGAWVKAIPHITKHKLTKDDHFLILACDGVYDVMSDKAVVETVDKEIEQKGITDTQRWARKLVDTAIKRETDDNVSVIAISLDERVIDDKSKTPKVLKKREKSLSFSQASSSAAMLKRRNSERSALKPATQGGHLAVSSPATPPAAVAPGGSPKPAEKK